jgi:hypothetical protein
LRRWRRRLARLGAAQSRARGHRAAPDLENTRAALRGGAALTPIHANLRQADGKVGVWMGVGHAHPRRIPAKVVFCTERMASRTGRRPASNINAAAGQPVSLCSRQIKALRGGWQPARHKKAPPDRSARGCNHQAAREGSRIQQRRAPCPRRSHVHMQKRRLAGRVVGIHPPSPTSF